MIDQVNPKLAGVHPELAQKIARVLSAMNMLGHRMIITDGLRTLEQQQALYAQGRTKGKSGAIVTNADGVKKKSNHQAKNDGFGHAVDCAFIGADGKPSWADSHPWKAYGENCKAVGLVWGGDFKSIVDKPHAELPA